VQPPEHLDGQLVSLLLEQGGRRGVDDQPGVRADGAKAGGELGVDLDGHVGAVGEQRQGGGSRAG
jgi:hypothetical protein